MKINPTHVFWFLLGLCILAFTWRVYAEVTKTDVINAPTTIEIVPEVTIQPTTEKEAIVANITHEEIKGPKYTIRVGLQGSRKPIPTIDGKSQDDRAKQWLDKVGLGHTLPTWKKLGDDYKLDYTLPLCIAWADSHLGKANKSTNNIGNVGNNDRGDVVHFPTLDAGIEAIFFTLRNYHTENRKAWMKDSTIIGELSGEGRKRLGLPGCVETKGFTKCYATSMGVWSSNVRNCMSVIHNKDINEDYHFRLQ